MASTADYAYARQLVHAYFAMLTVGCQNEDCSNKYCCSNPQTCALTATEAAIKSLYFAIQAPVPLCIELDQQQHETFTTETPELPQLEEPKVTSEPQPAEEEENQTENPLPSIGERRMSKEELHPETSEAEMLKIQQPETIVQSNPSPTRKSTPRQRLSVAVQLDNGLNKNRELPAKRFSMITRVMVQPKHKSVSTPEDDTVTASVTETTNIPSQQQQHEQPAIKASSSVKDARKRRMSRPKERLFDAIKRSFSRTKKAPLGSM